MNPTPSSLEILADEPADYVKRPPNLPNVLAVSGGGKYAAVACTDGIQLLSLPEAKRLAMLKPKADEVALSTVDPQLMEFFKRFRLGF